MTVSSSVSGTGVEQIPIKKIEEVGGQAPRKRQHRNAIGIDERLANSGVSPGSLHVPSPGRHVNPAMMSANSLLTSGRVAKNRAAASGGINPQN